MTQRPIKFRIYDKVSKRVVLVNSLAWDITGQVVSFNSGNFSDLMQFTGLLDKNDKEIYEGDILCWEDHPTVQEIVSFQRASFRITKSEKKTLFL